MSSAQDLAALIAELFSHCQEKEARLVNRFRVSIAESRSLRILGEHGVLTVNHLAQHMALSSSRVTRIIDRLVAKKMVLRETDASDRRIFNLSLTLTGTQMARELDAEYKKIHEEILALLPPPSHSSIFQSLKLLNQAVSAWLNQ